MLEKLLLAVTATFALSLVIETQQPPLPMQSGVQISAQQPLLMVANWIER